MSTTELQKSRELTHAADMAVRISSQLRLWLKRKQIGDLDCLTFSIDFLDQAISGGKFISSDGTATAGSLEPLSWSADLHFGKPSVGEASEDVNYAELIQYLSHIKTTLESIQNNSTASVTPELVQPAAKFFREMGAHLGTLADGVSQASIQRVFLAGDRFSL